MQIELDNVGIVAKSSINIDGLTVITGSNNSGKSTIGKVAFALIRSVSNYEVEAVVDRFYYAIDQLNGITGIFPFSFKYHLKELNVDQVLLDLFFDAKKIKNLSIDEIDAFIEKLANALESLSYDPQMQKSKSWAILDSLSSDGGYSAEQFNKDKNKALTLIKHIISNINGDPDYRKYIKQSVLEHLDKEFSSQLAPAKDPSCLVSIDVSDEGHKCLSLRLKDWSLEEKDGFVFEKSPYNNVFFVDDPYVIEDGTFWNLSDDSKIKGDSFIITRWILNHRNDLRRQLKRQGQDNLWQQVVLSENYKKIVNKIDEVLPGSFVKEGEETYYTNDENVKLKLSNLATGSKMFSIMKILLERGMLDSKTLLILDEPECHLHPEWQNKFAELVVLLINEIGCHVLLTTHSQNFMLAIDAMTRKYKIRDISNFYQAKKNGDRVSFENVNDNLKSIYANFLKSFSVMKMEYDSLLAEDKE